MYQKYKFCKFGDKCRFPHEKRLTPVIQFKPIYSKKENIYFHKLLCPYKKNCGFFKPDEKLFTGFKEESFTKADQKTKKKIATQNAITTKQDEVEDSLIIE